MFAPLPEGLGADDNLVLGIDDGCPHIALDHALARLHLRAVRVRDVVGNLCSPATDPLLAGLKEGPDFP